MDAVTKVVMCFCLAVTCLCVGVLFGYRTGWIDGKASVPVPTKIEQKSDVGQTQPVRPHIHGSPVGSPQK